MHRIFISSHVICKKGVARFFIMHASKPKAAHASVIKVTHEEERVALVVTLASALGIWYAFCNERYWTRESHHTSFWSEEDNR